MKSRWAEETIFQCIEPGPPMSEMRWSWWCGTRKNSTRQSTTSHYSTTLMLLVVRVVIIEATGRALVCNSMRHLWRWDGWRRYGAGQRWVVSQMKTRSAVSTAFTMRKHEKKQRKKPSSSCSSSTSCSSSSIPINLT